MPLAITNDVIVGTQNNVIFSIIGISLLCLLIMRSSGGVSVNSNLHIKSNFCDKLDFNFNENYDLEIMVGGITPLISKLKVLTINFRQSPQSLFFGPFFDIVYYNRHFIMLGLTVILLMGATHLFICPLSSCIWGSDVNSNVTSEGKAVQPYKYQVPHLFLKKTGMSFKHACDILTMGDEANIEASNRLFYYEIVDLLTVSNKMNMLSFITKLSDLSKSGKAFHNKAFINKYFNEGSVSADFLDKILFSGNKGFMHQSNIVYFFIADEHEAYLDVLFILNENL